MSFLFGNPFYYQPRAAPIYPRYSNHPAYSYDGYNDDEDDYYNGQEVVEDFFGNRYLAPKRPAVSNSSNLREQAWRQQQLQQEQLRRRRQQQQLVELQKRKLAQEFQRKVSLMRLNHAAKVIQRAFRDYRVIKAKKDRIQARVNNRAANKIQSVFRKHLAHKREQSAFILQRTLRRFKEQQEAKRVVKKLRLLNEIRKQIEDCRLQDEEKVLAKGVYERHANTNALIPNKDYLTYEDALLKILLKLDGVLSEGSETVRDKRKAVIATAQSLLAKLDEHKKKYSWTAANQTEEEKKALTNAAEQMEE